MAIRSKFEMGVRALAAATALLGSAALVGCGDQKPAHDSASWTFAARCPIGSELEVIYIDSFNHPDDVAFVTTCRGDDDERSMPTDNKVIDGPMIDKREVPEGATTYTLNASYEKPVSQVVKEIAPFTIMLDPGIRTTEVLLPESMLDSYQFQGQPLVEHFAVG